MSRLVQPSPFLRRVLRADAVVSAAVGLAMALAAPLIESLTGLPAVIVLPAGLALLPCAAYLLWLATRPAVPVAAVGVPIALNLLWAIDCAWVAFGGSFQPNGWGELFLAVQVVTVLLFAELEFIGLRRAEVVSA